MSCKDFWANELAGPLAETSRVAPGQVDGGQRCDHAGCDALVNQATATCVRGHVQGGGAAAEALCPAELDGLLCLAEEMDEREPGVAKWDQYPFSAIARIRAQREGAAGDGDWSYGRGVQALNELVAPMMGALPRAVWATDPRARAARRFLEEPWRAAELPEPAPDSDYLEMQAAWFERAVRRATGVDTLDVEGVASPDGVPSFHVGIGISGDARAAWVLTKQERAALRVLGAPAHIGGGDYFQVDPTAWSGADEDEPWRKQLQEIYAARQQQPPPSAPSPQEAEDAMLRAAVREVAGQWPVRSHSREGVFHQVTRQADGSWNCTCEWMTHRGQDEGADYCRHIKEVRDEGYASDSGTRAVATSWGNQLEESTVEDVRVLNRGSEEEGGVLTVQLPADLPAAIRQHRTHRLHTIAFDLMQAGVSLRVVHDLLPGMLDRGVGRDDIAQEVIRCGRCCYDHGAYVVRPLESEDAVDGRCPNSECASLLSYYDGEGLSDSLYCPECGDVAYGTDGKYWGVME